MIAGLILAGGLGRRLGGRNKALVTLHGRTMLSLVAARLRPQVDAVAISANDPLPADVAEPILPDLSDDRPGPLGGILAGLTWAEKQSATHLLSVAVDTPWFPTDLATQLSAGDPGAIAVARSNDRPHPTFALWPVALLQSLERFLADQSSRRVLTFIESHPHRFVTFDGDPDPFFNINTPEDIVTAEARSHG